MSKRRVAAIYWIEDMMTVEKYPLTKDGKLIHFEKNMSRNIEIPIPVEENDIKYSKPNTIKDEAQLDLSSYQFSSDDLIIKPDDKIFELEKEAYEKLFYKNELVDLQHFSDLILNRNSLEFVFDLQIPSAIPCL